MKSSLLRNTLLNVGHPSFMSFLLCPCSFKLLVYHAIVLNFNAFILGEQKKILYLWISFNASSFALNFLPSFVILHLKVKVHHFHLEPLWLGAIGRVVVM